MKKHITLLFTNNFLNRKTFTPLLTCTFVLIFLLSGYVDFSYATVESSIKGKPASQKRTASRTSKERWIKGRLLITPRAGLSAQEMQKALGPYGIQPRHHLKELNVHICDVPNGADENKIMNSLKKDDRFKAIELDMVVEPDLTISDPSFGNSWALQKIQTPTAWDTATGDEVIIAILDTGVNSNHPDLAANMVAGWNTFDNTENSADVHGHGTKVAGSAAAAANNGIGSAGVAWNAGIMPIRVTDLNGLGYYSTIAEGIRWAADHGARVANASFKDLAKSSTIKAAADYMRSKGGVVVVSAGNTGTLHNYAASNSLLVASATNSSDVRPSWSSYGPYVDVAAPGVSIYTTTSSGGYAYVNGTSFSSPITAATIALMISANNDLTPTDLDQIIKSTAVDIGTPGFDQYYGSGRINAAAAVAQASALITVDDQAPSITITAPTMNAGVSGVIPVDVNYADNVGVVRVELHINGQQITTDNVAPFEFVWDTTDWADGEHILTTKAFDAAGNTGTSSSVTVTTHNIITTPDTTAPTIVITAPDTDVVTGQMTITTNATDNISVTRVELLVDGQKVMDDDQAPFTFSWDTNQITDGHHTMTTKAIDAAGNVGTSPTISVIVSNSTPDDPSTNGIIVDNQASNTSLTGVWKNSSGISPFNNNSVYSDSNGTFRWEPILNGPGAHKVYAWWTYHNNRSSNIPYRINHANGTTQVNVNQHNQSLGGKWVLLGTFEFNANGTEYIEVSSENGQASADAVLLIPEEEIIIPTEIIIDNLDTSTSRTGTWIVSSGASPYETNSLYNNASSTFTWTIPSTATNGSHEVFVWWTYHPNRSSNVPYRVHHSTGIDTIVVNQRDQSQGGKWISLGTYSLKGDGTDKIVVSSENGQACADAVRIVRN